MKIRQFEFGRDYPEICEWWRARSWPEVPKRLLGRTGLIAEREVKYAAVWIYREDSFAIMDWLVTNPKAPLKGRKFAIESLLKFIKEEAKLEKIETICTFTANKNLIKLYQEVGFSIGDENLTSLILRG